MLYLLGDELCLHKQLLQQCVAATALWIRLRPPSLNPAARVQISRTPSTLLQFVVNIES